jgi:hypothetical protein
MTRRRTRGPRPQQARAAVARTRSQPRGSASCCGGSRLGEMLALPPEDEPIRSAVEPERMRRLGFQMSSSRDRRLDAAATARHGGDENDLVGLSLQLAPDASLPSPRGKVPGGAMARCRASRRPPLPSSVSPTRCRARMELADFVGAAAQTYECDSKRIVRSAFPSAPASAVGEHHRHPAHHRRGAHGARGAWGRTQPDPDRRRPDRTLMADLSGRGLRWTPPSRQPAAEPLRD